VLESYPAGTQQFQLRQWVQMNQEEVGLAFDSGSNCTIVTKEYAVRKKLKEIGPVISFSSLDTKMADLYQLPMWASGKRRITVNAVSVVAICNGPPARCPHDITGQFVQSRVASVWDWDLHQPGGVTDVCIDMDYPFLQPKHLEQEMRGGPLHLYKSVFGGGLILCGVEFPKTEKDEPAVDELRKDNPALEEPGEDQPALKEPEEDEPALDELGEEELALDRLGDDEPALDKPGKDKLALDKPAVVNPEEAESTLEELWEDMLALDELRED
jgi:hypothetical protein